MLEESWSHIQPCYEILVRIMVCPCIPTQIIKDKLSKTFISKLFNYMNSPDPRERDYVKTLVYQIYNKILIFRVHIRKLMFNLVLEHLYES